MLSYDWEDENSIEAEPNKKINPWSASHKFVVSDELWFEEH